MKVFLNGTFLPAEEARISIFDRGFLYADGLFETIRVFRGQPFLWEDHLDRLERGLTELQIGLPFGREELRARALELLASNQLRDATLRLTVSRGPGPRGYSPRQAGPPTVLLTAESAPAIERLHPEPVRLVTSRFRVPMGGPLTVLKTAGKLLHVLARTEAEAAGAEEALLLNESGHISETVAANIFWFEPDGRTVATPALEQGALDGVTRRLAVRLIQELGWLIRFTASPPKALLESTGAFLSVSTRGLVEVVALDSHSLPQDPRFERLQGRYRETVLRVISNVVSG